MLVLEEDARVVPGIQGKLTEVLCDLPDTWDVLYLNAHHKGDLRTTPRESKHATGRVTHGTLLYKEGSLMYKVASLKYDRGVCLGSQGLLASVVVQPASSAC